MAAKKETRRRRVTNDYREINIPLVLPERNELGDNYIAQCIDDGIFSTSYPDAKLLFDRANIVQIHRDLNEMACSGYRRKLSKKLGYGDDGTQIEFYIPAPAKYDKAIETYVELAVEEGKFAGSIVEATGKFGEDHFMRIVWSEISGRKEELAKAMGIDGPSAMFFVPFPYMYEKIK